MNKKILIGVAIAVLLGIGWYGLSPLLNNKEINEEIPLQNTPESTESARVEISDAVPVVDTPAHPASGEVRIVKSDGKTFVRYENYKTINGPDIQIWLAKDLKGSDYVNLGPLKATEGNINYEVPSGTDLSQYPYVLTWCEDFAVLFNSADISKILK